MNEVRKKADIGVIVGRFMCAELHEAHRDLIQSVLDRHERVIVFLGVSQLRNTMRNPLDFRHRIFVIQSMFPGVEVYPVEDRKCDFDWSRQLDANIRKLISPLQTVLLYGSRDSFLRVYQGSFPTQELESDVIVSASAQRKSIINNYPISKDFLAGYIAATGNRYPTSYQTVDVIIRNDQDQLLLVRKPDEKSFRFVGGFSDPRSESLEDDAKREVREEVGIEIGYPKYLFSCKIDDWRYKREIDCIKTAVFEAEFIFGQVIPNDDVIEAKWFDLGKLKDYHLEPEHRIIFSKYEDYLIPF